MNPSPELEPMLKQLRLSGIQDSLDQRNKEAIEHKMTYPEFLSCLLQDEVNRREQKKFQMLFRRSGLRGGKTLESFDFSRHPKLNRSLFAELATARFVLEPANVLLVGPCGVGKSHLARAIGHAVLQHGHEVLFTTQSDLLGSLSSARATGVYERRFQTLCRVPLLVIDEFALKPLRPDQDEDLHDLVSQRYEQTATLVTSNLDFSEWVEAFPNRLLGVATMDRLRHNAYCIVLEGQSYRAPRTLPETKESRK